MTKIMRSVTIEFDVWAEAKRRNVNISEACERGLLVYGDRRGEEEKTKLDRAGLLLTSDEKSKFSRLVTRFESWKPTEARETRTAFGTTVYREADLVRPKSPYEDIRKKIRALIGMSLTEHEVRDLFMRTPPS